MDLNELRRLAGINDYPQSTPGSDVSLRLDGKYIIANGAIIGEALVENQVGHEVIRFQPDTQFHISRRTYPNLMQLVNNFIDSKITEIKEANGS